MISPPAPAACPRCHAALPPGAPGGLCPSCLLDAAGNETLLDAPDPFGAPPDLEMLRRAFPQFEIIAPIGAGGMGRVYKVRQPQLDRIVALKILPQAFARDPAWVERFTREARALARLNHPHIVQVYDVGQTADVPPLCWLIMEYVDGVTLRQVQRTGGLSAREALAIIPRLCDALHYAHEKGVLHRDIKPENILLDPTGAVKIADFGLARLGGADSPHTLTRTGVRLGTAAYMAPEQIETPGDVDHRADIYSLGVVFYELLTGGLPLGRFPAPSEKSGIDPRLDHIVFRTLEKERDRRYQAAGEVRTALDRMSAPPVSPPPVPAVQPGTPVPPRPREFRQPPPVPPQTPPPGTPAVGVRFRDRDRPFPGSKWEATGYGCGLLLSAPLRFAILIAAVFTPGTVVAGLKKWAFQDWQALYVAHAGWVAALTGVAAFLMARPLINFTRRTREKVSSWRNPVLIFASLAVWGLTLVWLAREASSWPSTGQGRELVLSCERPPLPGPGQDGSQALDLMFQEETRKVFAGEEGIILRSEERSGDDTAMAADRNLLRKEWRLVAIGDTAQGVKNRLLRVGQGVILQLPARLRASVQIEVKPFHSMLQGSHVNIASEEALFATGFLMALGGWLSALGSGRSRVGYLLPLAPLAGAAVLSSLPGDWIDPGSLILPARDLPEARPALTLEALKPFTAEKDPKPWDTVFLGWMNACLRLDRATAEDLRGQSLLSPDWNLKAGFWIDNDLLYVYRFPDADENAARFHYNCLTVPRDPRQEKPRGYAGYFSPERAGQWITIVVVKKEDRWTPIQ